MRIRRGVDPDLIVRLPDGAHAAIAMSWTDSGGGAAETQTDHPLPLLELAGLQQVVRLLEQLCQEGRLPKPRRAPRTSSAPRSR